MDIALVSKDPSLVTELVASLHRRTERCPVETLHLVAVAGETIDVAPSAVVEASVQRAEEIGAPFAVHASACSDIADVDVVIIALDPDHGADTGWDKDLANHYTFPADGTIGVGGIATAMNTIPTALTVARQVARLAPDTQLVNLTPPIGVTTESIHQYGELPVVGVDSVPFGIQQKISRWLGAPIIVEYVGLNRFGWVRRIQVRKRDRTNDLLVAYAWILSQDPDAPFSPDVVRSLAAYPNPYLRYYYGDVGNVTPSDAVPKRSEPTPIHYQAEATASLLMDMMCDANNIHVVNVPNAGAIPNLSDDVVIETSCRVSRAGIAPLSVDPLPPVMWGMVNAVKGAELLTVEAALHRDRMLLRLALLMHPLGPENTNVEALVEKLLGSYPKK